MFCVLVLFFAYCSYVVLALKETLRSLRSHNGNCKCNVSLPLFQSFRFKWCLIFCSNFLPLTVPEVVFFNFTTWKPHLWRSVLQIYAFKVKLSRFKWLCLKETDSFSASLSARIPLFGILDDILNVAYVNNIFFAESQMTSWLALPS